MTMIAECDHLETGAPVLLEGWMAPFEHAPGHTHFALIDEAPCCLGCLPRDTGRRVEVFASRTIPATGGLIQLRGTLIRLESDESGWRYKLMGAELVRSAPRLFTRRTALAASILACVGVSARAEEPVTEAAARDVIAGHVTVDIHSHAGAINGTRSVAEHAPFRPVATPMREGGMAVICLAAVPDSPTHKVMPDRRIRAFRDPEPGELYAFGNQAFQRVHDLAAAQNLHIVTNAADLEASRSDRPGIIVSSEGADFLEGRIERVAEAYSRWSLRHLQLTHYRVNELGDIQTEEPVHNGLTDFGVEVIKACNRQGIVVDVAHGTFDLVKRAAAVTSKPLVLSHTSLSANPGPRSRTISPDHARLIAGTGGVIGIWPPATIFHDKAALAAGMARMADLVGIDHVGLGSDMLGLVGASSFAGYDELPALAQALLQRGFSADETRKLLGGNYQRAFAASLG